MYKGTLIDNLLGVVEGAEKSSRNTSVPNAERSDEPASEGTGEGRESEPEQFA
ncbi:MAG: hypothetical protein ACRD3B_09745 [Candidatus Sulfotelmatobacter sp.]